MAGKGGGGAWKVAYADFVTAMMAFFLVMWICGQDQKIKRAVSYYFNDPFESSKIGNAKKLSKLGSLNDHTDTGSVPESEKVALGRGRDSYSPKSEASPTTKLVSEWILTDPAANKYWRQQAALQRESARKSRDAGVDHGSVERMATQLLGKQLKEEITRSIPAEARGIYQDLLFEGMSEVNWTEIAEDLLANH
jgi:chemotaxis protein MotB